MKATSHVSALVAAAICVATASSPSLADTPDKFLEYVESTSAGGQYIDTGIEGKCNTKAELKVQWTQSADKTFLGTLAASGGDTRFLLCATDKDGKISGGHRTYDRGTIVRSSTAPDHVVSSITHDGTKAAVSVVVNGSASVNVTRTEAALDTERNMYLFARHEANDSVNYKSLAKCYSAKIWQMDGNGEWQLVRDYRPCLKDSKAGLYDAVSKEISFSRSSTDFVAGPVLKPDYFIQYVESTGTQYIDTEVVGRPNTAMQAHVLWTTVSDTYFLASRTDGGNTRFCLYGCNTTHYMAHQTYQTGRDSTENANGYTPGNVHYNASAPDYISSSISHDGTTLSYWLEVNGTRRFTRTRTEAALDTGLNMYLFGCNQGGVLKLPSKVRCYDLKIWQDDVLVRDFRPCLKSGRAGMYDAVSGWIYFPQGGELNYPNETPDKFVRWAIVPGANYVPVAVPAKTGVMAEMKFRPTSNSTVDQYFLAARGASNTQTRFLLNYVYWKDASNNRITIGYRNKWDARSWYNWSVGQDYTLVSKINASGGIEGTLTGYGSPNNVATPTSGAWDSGLYLYMFAINMGGNAQDYFTGRFHYTKIWEWNEATSDYSLVRDFKPCIKDNSIMFFDEVSQTMFRPYPAIPAVKGNYCPKGAMIIAK